MESPEAPESAQAVPALGQFTGYLLRRAHVRALGCVRGCISPDLHIREVVVLSILAERGAISQRALGDLMHVNRSIMVTLVDGLERKHLVVRERNPQDRRSYALRLTDAGERARAEAHRDLDAAEAHLTGALTKREAARLKRALTLLLADDADELGSVSDRLGNLIARAHGVWRARAEAALSPLGLHPREFGALAAIAGGRPCSQNELAARLGISPPMALTVVDLLESRRLVLRSAHPADRRVHHLTLTETGDELLRRAHEAAGGVQRELAARLDRQGDAELRALLAKVAEIVP